MSDSQQVVAIRQAVLSEMTRIGQQQGKLLSPLTDALPLLETGMDSLCFAILVATLDDHLGFDPFDGDGRAEFPLTVGALVAAYEAAYLRREPNG